MKAIHWFVLIAVALGAVGVVLARAEASGKPEADMRALRQQVVQLQSQLKTLEGRLAKLESTRLRVEVVPNVPQTPSLIIPPSRTGQQPKTWGQGEINGWPFYFIPCGGR